MPSSALKLAAELPEGSAAGVVHEPDRESGEQLAPPRRAKILRADRRSVRALNEAFELTGVTNRGVARRMQVDESIVRDMRHGERIIDTERVFVMPPTLALAFLELLRARVAQKLLVLDVDAPALPASPQKGGPEDG